MQGDIPAQNISSLGYVLRAVGGLTKPSGRGLFMFQSLIAGSSTAAIGGLMGASILGPLFTAGAAGFIGGSCIGFVFGTIKYYRDSYQQSFITFSMYPELLKHHIFMDYGMRGDERVERFLSGEKESIMEEVKSSVILQGMLIAAWHSAIPAIENIQDQEEAAIITTYGSSPSDNKD